MRDYKVNPNRGFRKWATIMTQLNQFIPYIPSEALYKKKVLKELFKKMDHQEPFISALPRSYCLQLLNMEQNVYEGSHNKTVKKLEQIEPSIKVEALKD